MAISNQTRVIRDACKKAQWQTSGTTFHQLHLLFDKHYGEQVLIMDAIAECVPPPMRATTAATT